MPSDARVRTNRTGDAPRPPQRGSLPTRPRHGCAIALSYASLLLSASLAAQPLPPPALTRVPASAASSGSVSPGVRSTLPPEERILVQAWAETEAIISSPIVGLVLQIPTRPGTRFDRNELLIRYECTENEARAQIAQSELTAASETHEAKIRLQAMNAASEIEVTTAAAQAAKAEAQLKLSQYQVRQCQLLAPFDGFVVRVMGKPHQTTTVGQPMLEIISAGTPRLRVVADSRLFTRIRVGTPLRVTIDETGYSYPAQVTLVNARIDPVNQTFDMEARLTGNAAGLLPGMSGSAVIADTGPGTAPGARQR